MSVPPADLDDEDLALLRKWNLAREDARFLLGQRIVMTGRLQRALRMHLDPNLLVDGMPGPRTQAALDTVYGSRRRPSVARAILQIAEEARKYGAKLVIPAPGGPASALPTASTADGENLPASPQASTAAPLPCCGQPMGWGTCNPS